MGKLAGFLKRVKNGTKKVGKLVLQTALDPIISALDIVTSGGSTSLLKILGHVGKKGEEKYKLEKGPKGWFLRAGSKVLKLGNVFQHNSGANVRKMLKQVTKEIKDDYGLHKKDLKKLDTSKQEVFDN